MTPDSSIGTVKLERHIFPGGPARDWQTVWVRVYFPESHALGWLALYSTDPTLIGSTTLDDTGFDRLPDLDPIDLTPAAGAECAP